MKRKIINLVIASTIVLTIAGCSDKKSSFVKLVDINATAILYPGDSIEHLEEGTQVSIKSSYGQDGKTITLLSGSVQIIRGDY
jgi:uncharacterized lipoprotein YehR (DUF1307 family)